MAKCISSEDSFRILKDVEVLLSLFMSATEVFTTQTLSLTKFQIFSFLTHYPLVTSELFYCTCWNSQTNPLNFIIFSVCSLHILALIKTGILLEILLTQNPFRFLSILSSQDSYHLGQRRDKNHPGSYLQKFSSRIEKQKKKKKTKTNLSLLQSSSVTSMKMFRSSITMFYLT